MQAMIAGYHTNASDPADTNWTRIAALYDRLVTIDPSPIVALNRAVAIGMAESPQAGLAALPEGDDLATYHLFHAAESELHLLAGNAGAAREAFANAHRLARNPAEIRHLERRIADTA